DAQRAGAGNHGAGANHHYGAALLPAQVRPGKFFRPIPEAEKDLPISEPQKKYHAGWRLQQRHVQLTNPPASTCVRRATTADGGFPQSCIVALPRRGNCLPSLFETASFAVPFRVSPAPPRLTSRPLPRTICVLPVGTSLFCFSSRWPVSDCAGGPQGTRRAARVRPLLLHKQ
ncbi:unnamed protein product, partial [Phaeothamnion confervicola]